MGTSKEDSGRTAAKKEEVELERKRAEDEKKGLLGMFEWAKEPRRCFRRSGLWVKNG